MVAKIIKQLSQQTNQYCRSVTIQFSHRIFDPIATKLPSYITPNIITWLRAFLVPIIIILLINDYYIYALIIYGIAVSSDGIDGSLARVRGLITKQGSILDPTVDKVLHTAVFMVFLSNAPILILTTIILDLILALAVAIMLVPHRTHNIITNMKSNFAGKLKFFFQATALIFLFLGNITNIQFLFSLANIALACAIFFLITALIIYFRNIIYAINS